MGSASIHTHYSTHTHYSLRFRPSRFRPESRIQSLSPSFFESGDAGALAFLAGAEEAAGLLASRFGFLASESGLLASLSRRSSSAFAVFSSSAFISACFFSSSRRRSSAAEISSAVQPSEWSAGGSAVSKSISPPAYNAWSSVTELNGETSRLSSSPPSSSMPYIAL
jgi:hypothetical protein